MMATRSRAARRLKAGFRMLIGYPSRLFNKVSLSAIIVNSEIDATAALDARVRFYRSSLGRYSYVGRGSTVESCSIRAFCSISGDCNIGGAAHPLENVTTSPVFCSGGNILRRNLAAFEFDPFQQTSIGNDVWIGTGVKVKAGLTISDGAVLGMGSVVTHNVGPYEVWAGNPARLIRKRFDDETIGRLLESEWWTWEDVRLAAAGKAVDDIDGFFELGRKAKEK